MTAISFFQWASAITGFLAAGFWLRSALVKIPGVPFGGSGGAYSAALTRATIANAVAAGLSGVSVLCSAVATLLGP